jgi:molybdopterin/thiamine biosynthesis adenylyltransferase
MTAFLIRHVASWLRRSVGSAPAPAPAGDGGVRVTMTMHAAVARAVREAVASELEVAGVLIVSVSETPSEIRLLVREFHPAASYEHQSPTELRLSPSAYMPALARAHRLGASALFLHTHPTAAPTASSRDDLVDEQLRSVFQIRTRSSLYGSMVVRLVDGTLGFSGRAWRGEDRLGPIVLLREIGDRFVFTSALDAPAPLPSPAAFNRQVLAFGEAIQELLQHLHVGVVGAGGTGSAIGEQLIRSGVGRVTVVDDQALEDTNVTRVYGSAMSQVGMAKVAVFEANARRIGLDTKITTLRRKVDRTALEALQGCDVIFACTDDHSGRFDVARLAYWCLIPVFDLGAQFDPVDSPQQGIYSRVDIMMPGTPCPQCTGLSDPEVMLAEGLPEDERAERIREGYLPGQGNRDPAVIAFTTIAACLGLGELFVRFTGLGSGSPSRLLLYVHERKLKRIAMPIKGHWCSDPLTWGAVSEGKRYLGSVWP